MKKSISLKIEYADPKTLELAPWNPKDHTERGLNAIDESLNEFGWMDVCVVWQGKVIDGNARLKVALERGEKEVPIIRRDDLTEEQAKAYTLVSNRIPQFMVDDEQKVYDLAKSLPIEKVASFYTEDELEEKRNYLQSLLQSRAERVENELHDEVDARKNPPKMVLSLHIPLEVWEASGEVWDDWFKAQVEEHPEFGFTKRRTGG